MTWGVLKSYKCSDTNYYVCEKSLGVPQKCAQGWELFGNSCYKRYHHQQRPWDEARETCTKQDADLVVINSHTENDYIYEFANHDEVNVWLGLRENVSLQPSLQKLIFIESDKWHTTLKKL